MNIKVRYYSRLISHTLWDCRNGNWWNMHNCRQHTAADSGVVNVLHVLKYHYNDVIMCAMASQITSLTIVYSTVYSGTDQRKHQSFAPLAFVRGIHRWPVNSPYKWPVTLKLFSFDNVIMIGMIAKLGDIHLAVRGVYWSDNLFFTCKITYNWLSRGPRRYQAELNRKFCNVYI